MKQQTGQKLSRSTAAACPAVTAIFRGVVTGQINVDYAKLMRGSKIVSKPAFYRLNPLAYTVLKLFLKNYYKKLLGTMAVCKQLPGIRASSLKIQQ